MQSITAMAAWLEGTPLALWVSESDFVYPLLLSVHIVGLATFAGLQTMIALRLLGGLATMPFAGLRGPMRLAWSGLILNAISGVALFASQATVFVGNTPFLIKLAMITVAALSAAVIHKRLKHDAVHWDTAGRAGNRSRAIATLTLAAIAAAIIAGRLIAYF
ncbi:MAG: hypothetical protein L0Y45_08350 [Woeseiaceae bacterium]|nr:hypothetical protein [Woeseiaceae bacterium]